MRGSLANSCIISLSSRTWVFLSNQCLAKRDGGDNWNCSKAVFLAVVCVITFLQKKHRPCNNQAIIFIYLYLCLLALRMKMSHQHQNTLNLKNNVVLCWNLMSFLPKQHPNISVYMLHFSNILRQLVEQVAFKLLKYCSDSSPNWLSDVITDWTCCYFPKSSP